MGAEVKTNLPWLLAKSKTFRGLLHWQSVLESCEYCQIGVGPLYRPAIHHGRVMEQPTAAAGFSAYIHGPNTRLFLFI